MTKLLALFQSRRARGAATPPPPTEPLLNCTFDSADGWNMATGWAIEGGKLVGTAAGEGPSLITPILTAGHTYTVTFDLVVTSGSVQIWCGAYGTERTTSGTYTENITASNANFGVDGIVEFTGTIDNLIVTDIT